MISCILNNIEGFLKNAIEINRSIKKIYNNSNPEYCKKVKSILKKYGRKNITKLSVHRELMPDILIKFFNFSTFGDLYKNMKKQGIDNLYHVWFEIEVDGFNEIIIIEKNNIINAEIKYDYLNKTEFIDISLNQSISLNKFLQNGVKKIGKKNFYSFIFPHINCQNWCLNILKSNTIDIEKYQDFILQKIFNKKMKNKDLLNKLIWFVSIIDLPIESRKLNIIVFYSLIILALLICITYFLMKKIYNSLISCIKPFNISIPDFKIEFIT
jgi:hypothetical protein